MLRINRGSTQSITYTLPFPAERLEKAYVTIVQDGEVVIEKSLEDMKIYGNEIVVELTQKETLKLNSDSGGAVQLRYLDINGDADRTEPLIFTVGMLLKDGEI
jgi:hypothetical protein